MTLDIKVYGTETGRISSSASVRSNTPKSAGPLTRYRVELGYGELGSDENIPLAEWSGEAESEEQAKEFAYGEHWDPRLDAGGSVPRYKVTVES